MLSAKVDDGLIMHIALSASLQDHLSRYLPYQIILLPDFYPDVIGTQILLEVEVIIPTVRHFVPIFRHAKPNMGPMDRVHNFVYLQDRPENSVRKIKSGKIKSGWQLVYRCTTYIQHIYRLQVYNMTTNIIINEQKGIHNRESWGYYGVLYLFVSKISTFNKNKIK